MHILEKDFYDTYYFAIKESKNIFYLSNNPFPVNLELDIKYITHISSPLVSHINHVGMFYGDITSYPPTQDESPFIVSLPTQVFNFNEEIMEAITTSEYLWDDCQHRSYLLPQSINLLLPFSNQCTI